MPYESKSYHDVFFSSFIPQVSAVILWKISFLRVKAVHGLAFLSLYILGYCKRREVLEREFKCIAVQKKWTCWIMLDKCTRSENVLGWSVYRIATCFCSLMWVGLYVLRRCFCSPSSGSSDSNSSSSEGSRARSVQSAATHPPPAPPPLSLDCDEPRRSFGIRVQNLPVRSTGRFQNCVCWVFLLQ